MTEQQIKWVLTKRLAELTGYTVEAIRMKAKNDVWPEGVAWKLAPDGNRIFNVPAIQLWMSTGGWGAQAASASATPDGSHRVPYNSVSGAKASGVARRDTKKSCFLDGEHRHFL